MVLALVPVLLGASARGPRKPVPHLPLVQEYEHPSGRFALRLPAGWKVVPVEGRPDTVEAGDEVVALRLLHRPQEAGFDGLHVTCMAERLTGPMDVSPRTRYEYDFVSSTLGQRRVLDSAFEVQYDAPVRGHRVWRQRNVTIVGEGQSLCVMAHVPLPVWKKSRQLQSTLDAVLGSLSFR